MPLCLYCVPVNGTEEPLGEVTWGRGGGVILIPPSDCDISGTPVIAKAGYIKLIPPSDWDISN